MALPQEVEQQDSQVVSKAVFDLANTISNKVGIAIDGVKQAVIPSIPDMISKITADIQSGSLIKFERAIEILNKKMREFGFELSTYNKSLADFLKQREETLEKSEKEIQQIRKNGIIAEIDKFSGEINYLSREEIKKRNQQLALTNQNIKNTKDDLDKQRKILQEKRVVSEKTRELAKIEIAKKQEQLTEQEILRERLIETLGDKAEDKKPGIFNRIRGGVERTGQGLSNTFGGASDYIPAPILGIISGFTEALTAPFTAIKEFGMQIGEFLKPLKLVKDLFTGVFKGLKNFAGGLSNAVKGVVTLFKPLMAGLKRFIASLAMAVVSFLPFIAIGVAIVAALGALYFAVKKIASFLGFGKEGREREKLDKQQGTGKYQSLDEGTMDAIGNQYAPGDAKFVNEYGVPKAEFVPKSEEQRIREQDNNTLGNNKILPNGNIRSTFTSRKHIGDAIPAEELALLRQNAGMTNTGTTNNVASNQVVNSAVNNSVSSVSLTGTKNNDTWYDAHAF